MILLVANLLKIFKKTILPHENSGDMVNIKPISVLIKRFTDFCYDSDNLVEFSYSIGTRFIDLAGS